MARRAGEAWLGTHDVLLHEPMVVRLRAFDGDRTAVDSVRAQVVWEPGRLVPYYAVPEQDVLAGLRPIRRPPPEYADHAVDVFPGLRMLPPGMFRLHTSPGEELAVEVGGGWREGRPSGSMTLTSPATWCSTSPRSTAGWRRRSRSSATRGTRSSASTSGAAARTYGSRATASCSPTATTRRCSLETMLPPRWYLPAEDVRIDVMLSSTSRTVCAYKGFADYWAVTTADGEIDVCWTYRDPLTDALAGQGHGLLLQRAGRCHRRRRAARPAGDPVQHADPARHRSPTLTGMAVERLLPTEEAYDLLALTREIAAERLAPRAAADEAAGAFPRDVFSLLGAGRVCWRCPTRRSSAAATSRTRSTCRRWRRSPAPG